MPKFQVGDIFILSNGMAILADRFEVIENIYGYVRVRALGYNSTLHKLQFHEDDLRNAILEKDYLKIKQFNNELKEILDE